MPGRRWRCFSPVKPLENTRQIRRVHARAVVPHRHAGRAVAWLDGHRHHRGLARVIRGVLDEVEQGLPQPFLVKAGLHEAGRGQAEIGPAGMGVPHGLFMAARTVSVRF